MGKITDAAKHFAPKVANALSDGGGGGTLKDLLSGDGLESVGDFSGSDGLAQLADMAKGGNFDIGSVIKGAKGGDLGNLTGISDAIDGVSVPPPPDDATRKAQADDILKEQQDDKKNLTPDQLAQKIKKAEDLDADGPWKIWQDKAKAFREKHPGPEGWMVTARMDAAIAAAGAAAYQHKNDQYEDRPYLLDKDIEKHGKVETDSSYPSGHSAAAAAAAAVLDDADSDPADRADYDQTALDVQWARQYSGMHLKSDTDEGAAIGKQVADKIIAKSK